MDETNRPESDGLLTTDFCLARSRYLLTDRDTKFCEMFRFILLQVDVRPVTLPTRSPNLNAHMERFMRSLKDECLRRMIFFGEASLRKATRQFVEHYHQERNHQGLANRLIEPRDEVGRRRRKIRCRERLGGLLKYYYRDAA